MRARDMNRVELADLSGDPFGIGRDPCPDGQLSCRGEARARRHVELVDADITLHGLGGKSRQHALIEARVERTDALRERRMRRQDALQSRREEHVRHLLGARRAELRACRETCDLQQRFLQPAGVARELDRGGIGEPLALAAHGGLEDAPGEQAERSEHHEGERRDQDGPTALASTARRDAQNRAADQRDDEEAKEPPHQLHVQAHVAVHHVAELMGDHTLQLLAVQGIESALCDGDGRVGRRMPRGKGIDAGFVLEHVDLGHRHAGGDRHFLDHVAQSAALEILRVRIEPHATEREGDDAAARAQLQGFDETRDADEGQEQQRAQERATRMARRERQGRKRATLGLARAQQGKEHQIEREDDAGDCQQEAHHQPPRLAARGGLARVEIHVSRN
jgi:hypothetical protein